MVQGETNQMIKIYGQHILALFLAFSFLTGCTEDEMQKWAAPHSTLTSPVAAPAPTATAAPRRRIEWVCDDLVWGKCSFEVVEE